MDLGQKPAKELRGDKQNEKPLFGPPGQKVPELAKEGAPTSWPVLMPRKAPKEQRRP